MKSTASSDKGRLGWMDVLRGVAVSLVVLDHALFFARTAETATPWTLEFFSGVLNPLRMPLMVFLSGLLLGPSLAKGPAAYLDGKLRNILYPFLLWSTAYIAIWNLMSSTTGSDHSWADLAVILWDPPVHLWFLRDLFVIYLIALLLAGLPAWGSALAAFAASAAAAVADGAAVQESAPQRFFFLLGFFLLGAWAARRGGLESLVAGRPARLAGAILALLLVPTAFYLGNLRYEAASIPLAAGGIAMAALLGRFLDGTAMRRLFRFLGRNSLAVYVVHWMAISVTSKLWPHLLPDLGGGTLTLLLAASGLGVGIVAAWARESAGAAWLFGLPGRFAILGRPDPRANAAGA